MSKSEPTPTLSTPETPRRSSLTRLIHWEVPLIVAIIIALVVMATATTALSFFRDKALNYTIHLPTSPENNSTVLAYGEQPALSKPNFFTQVKQQFINEQAGFVEVDLSAMLVRVYQQGALVLEVPVKSKGREGSWWETPAGIYKISTKEKNHFSSLGHVYQPWSMRFQGNFYIHGWPYYPDGTPVASEFSGGCIRLSTEDAKKVFDLIELGTPILVFEQDFSSDNFVYSTPGPDLSTNIYLAADLRNNHVLTQSESTLQVPIASITKLMTALVTTEHISLDKQVTVSEAALIYTSKPRLQAGDSFSLYQLLFPLLLESSNEAAETIARSYGRSGFIKLMNEKAAAIGMTHTTFTDPSGVDPDNISTAEDLFMLAKYIHNNRSFIFKITAGKMETSAYGTSGFSDLSNFNNFVGEPFFIGGKNGKTEEAGESNLSVFELPVGQNKRPVVMIVLGSSNEAEDAETLRRYTLSNLEAN